MPPRSSKDHDFVTVARFVVGQAMGEHLDATPLANPDDGKNSQRRACCGERRGARTAAHL